MYEIEKDSAVVMKKKNIFQRKEKLGTVLKPMLAIVILVIQIYPIFYVMTSSLKTPEDFRNLATYALPSSLNLENYITVFFTSPMVNYFKNSMIILIGSLIILLSTSLMAAFALSKIKFKGNKKLFSFFMLGLMLPFQVALIPLFTIFSETNVLNTYFAVIMPQVAFSLSFSISLFYSFCKFLPDDVIEAAIIDGCSSLGIFTKIVVPMSKNAILTVATMQGVFCWNDFICANTFTRTTDMKTITLGLNDFVGFMGLTDWGATFAAITVTVLPTFIFYFLASKYMLEGMSAGAVKG
ncbi:carbohydrate ABC transporter permease [Lederbergia sp. NSJ-179]|uniref:carbohydrate ABC transporter permease n=1 Tax=Lederbergia sp. NSJ-179 TaxID=2931402 RepID=UPI001FD42224|nr:carbohydrate ABC transporter permease [Lederbergia sp. NSJ-179]MCJ7842129.1 carbohydrate ABC transporter permease [Lederbergia sp. NSJ-179]